MIENLLDVTHHLALSAVLSILLKAGKYLDRWTPPGGDHSGEPASWTNLL